MPRAHKKPVQIEAASPAMIAAILSIRPDDLADAIAKKQIKVFQTSGFAGNGGIVTKSRLLSIEGALGTRVTNLFDALLSVAPPRPQG